MTDKKKSQGLFIWRGKINSGFFSFCAIQSDLGGLNPVKLYLIGNSRTSVMKFKVSF